MAYSFEWDKKKAASNLKDHVVSFVEATTVFGDIMAMNMPILITPRARSAFRLRAS